MRLLTHNTLTNNSAEAKGKGFPLKISAKTIRVDENTGASTNEQQQVAFVKSLLPSLDWNALVEAASELGVPTLPPTLTVEMAEDQEFCKALYHILMNLHLVEGMLTCPATGREFPVVDGIPNMMIEEEDAAPVRM